MPFLVAAEDHSPVAEDHSAMHAASIESLVSRYFAAINAADFDAFDTLLADDFVQRVGGRQTDKNGFRGF